MASLRYSRQTIMPQVGTDGQLLLSSSKVLVVGAGGIGSTVAQYLIASGVPTDILDFDVVEVSNLHRQIIHDEGQAGKQKALSAVERMRSINSSVQSNAIVSKLTPSSAADIISLYDMVVDATDNIDARYTINDCCVILRKPFVSGSAVSLDGQITTVIPFTTPCYRCMYPNLSVTMGGCRSCADAGVLGPVPGLIGCLQAMEVLKLLLNRDKYIPRRDNSDTADGSTGTSHENVTASRNNGRSAGQLKPLLGRQVMYDGASGEFHTFALPQRRPDCAVCGEHPTILTMADSEAVQRAQASGKVCRPAANGLSDESDSAVPPARVVAATEQAPLPSVHRIKVSDFAAYLRNVPTATDTNAGSALILDVRSPEQFGMLHLQPPYVQASYASLAECLQELRRRHTDSSGGTSDGGSHISDAVGAVVVNVPLAQLKGGKAAADRQHNQQQVLQQLREVQDLLRHPPSSAAGVDTFVLCRRGVDSVTATQLLLRLGWQQGGQSSGGHQGGDVEYSCAGSGRAKEVGGRVMNVEGGLTAWSAEVDPTMVMY